MKPSVSHKVIAEAILRRLRLFFRCSDERCLTGTNGASIIRVKSLVLKLTVAMLTEKVDEKVDESVSAIKKPREIQGFRCRRGGSNPYTFRYRILSPARLPIPPLLRFVVMIIGRTKRCPRMGTNQNNARRVQFGLPSQRIGTALKITRSFRENRRQGAIPSLRHQSVPHDKRSPSAGS